MTRRRYILVGLGLIAIVAAIVAYVHRVPTALTPEDRRVFERLVDGELGSQMGSRALSFPAQVAQIRRAQDLVFSLAPPPEPGPNAPEPEPIPRLQPREPADLAMADSAQCFDRARSLYKFYRWLGYEVRYAALYDLDEAASGLDALTTSSAAGQVSHAAVEVLTVKGWMVVDSVDYWIGLDENGVPLSFGDMQMARDEGRPLAVQEESMPDMYRGRFLTVYGLYSRHGQFYAPYTLFVPDVDWLGLWDNWKLYVTPR